MGGKTSSYAVKDLTPARVWDRRKYLTRRRKEIDCGDRSHDVLSPIQGEAGEGWLRLRQDAAGNGLWGGYASFLEQVEGMGRGYNLPIRSGDAEGD